MKHPFHLSLIACTAMAVAGFMTSCAGVFTKDDARAIGTHIAKESVAIAKEALAGNDWQAAATNLGLDIAGLALEKITDNLTAPDPVIAPPLPMSSSQPEVLLTNAATVAEQQITTLTDDPATASLAQFIACQACDTAKQLVATDPGGKTAATVLPKA